MALAGDSLVSNSLLPVVPCVGGGEEEEEEGGY